MQNNNLIAEMYSGSGNDYSIIFHVLNPYYFKSFITSSWVMSLLEIKL